MPRGVRRVKRAFQWKDRPTNACWRCGLNNLLTPAAGLLEPDRLDDLQFCRDELQNLGDIFAQQTQRATAFRAGIAWIEHVPFTRCVVGDLWLSPATWS